MDTKVELRLAIKSAKNAVLENDFLKAKGLVEKCVNILNGIYRSQTLVVKRAGVRANLNKLEEILFFLEQGDEFAVKKWFGLIEEEETDKCVANPVSINSNGELNWIERIWTIYKNSVFQILGKTDLENDEIEYENGTGFVISSKGYLLTNSHVIRTEAGEYHQSLSIRLSNGNIVNIEIVCDDKENDVALCKFDPQEVGEVSIIKLTDSCSKLIPGADVVVLGNALGLGVAPISGMVRVVENNYGNLVINCNIQHGDSGGPVLNKWGECIGINKSITTHVGSKHAHELANATHADTIKQLLEKWCAQYNIKL